MSGADLRRGGGTCGWSGLVASGVDKEENGSEVQEAWADLGSSSANLGRRRGGRGLRKRAKPTIMLRPTASFSTYHDFMQSLVQHMELRYFAAYEDSVFRHYVYFGPPGVDLPTFEHILSQWDKKRKKFVFTDRNDGEEIACSCNLEWVMPHDIDEDAEQPNKAVEKMELPQQVIYWKSITSINQALHHDYENKFKDTPYIVGGIDIQYEGDVNQSLFDEANRESEHPPTGRAHPLPFFSDINKESEDAPPWEVPPPEDYRNDTDFKVEINEGENVFKPAKELLTCTETNTQHEETRREIMPVDDVHSAGHDTETQTCIG
ncbi:uncharacterized protein A4U43_C04F19280 [Asparagus officinalis]|uniref:Uncharacterized protein n=1 Tax=Asparagus officinalis TaxID=4686 RepID=A0A5P1F3X3_ASPOF|nr:uncharacterized protein A4U43_C04F19280 [Asparagus officinalis]